MCLDSFDEALDHASLVPFDRTAPPVPLLDAAKPRPGRPLSQVHHYPGGWRKQLNGGPKPAAERPFRSHVAQRQRFHRGVLTKLRAAAQRRKSNVNAKLGVWGVRGSFLRPGNRRRRASALPPPRFPTGRQRFGVGFRPRSRKRPGRARPFHRQSTGPSGDSQATCGFRTPRRIWSSSIDSNSALKFPSPNPSSPFL
jgi:hypothetical protein